MFRGLPIQGLKEIADDITERVNQLQVRDDRRLALLKTQVLAEGMEASPVLESAFELDSHNLTTLMNRIFSLGYFVGSTPLEFEGLVLEKVVKYGLINYPEGPDDVWTTE